MFIMNHFFTTTICLMLLKYFVSKEVLSWTNVKYMIVIL